ncbi:hypothetical protein BDW74DRAFT_83431 [Aspergillus multicolor]|uniref:uncharacterized protein n=1 Tax=Aspergillus multicolor TaxID=41759 RepID=UPI003CCD9159
MTGRVIRTTGQDTFPAGDGILITDCLRCRPPAGSLRLFGRASCPASLSFNMWQPGKLLICSDRPCESHYCHAHCCPPSAAKQFRRSRSCTFIANKVLRAPLSSQSATRLPCHSLQIRRATPYSLPVVVANIIKSRSSDSAKFEMMMLKNCAKLIQQES